MKRKFCPAIAQSGQVTPVLDVAQSDTYEACTVLRIELLERGAFSTKGRGRLDQDVVVITAY